MKTEPKIRERLREFQARAGEIRRVWESGGVIGEPGYPGIIESLNQSSAVLQWVLEIEPESTPKTDDA